MNKFQVFKASAGSGKTSSMVQEYLLLALSNEQPDYFKRILCITFTNKAANELKERIIHTLQSICELDESEFPKKYFIKPLLDQLGITPSALKTKANKSLSLMLHQYAELSVSTIDSFMHRLVRSFTRDLKLPANFQVELDADLLLSEAVEELIALVGIDEKINTSLREFVLERLDDEKNFRIEDEIKNMAANLLNDHSIAFIRLLEQIPAENFTLARKKLKMKIADFEQKIKAFSDKVKGIVDERGVDVNDFSYKKNGVVGYMIGAYSRLLKDGLLTPGNNVLKCFELASWAPAKTDTVTAENVSYARAEIEPVVGDFLAFLDTAQRDYIVQNLILERLHSLSLLNDLQIIINQKRKESGRVHISEFNKRVLDIVASESVPFIYERLGERYNHILIDEFQDTSVAQWRNLMPLLENAVSKGFRSMIVGDGKQAIYRWRGGFAEQFTAMPELRPVSDDFLLNQRFNQLQSSYVQKHLSVNRRSCREIVAFNNDFFRFLSLHPDYTEAIAPIYEDLEQEFDPEKTGGVINISFVDYENGKREKFREECLNRTLSLIQELTSKYNYSYADIALLTRGNRDASDLARYLILNEIPVISSEALLINNSPEVQLLLAFIKLIASPDEQTAVLVILNYLQQRQLIDDSSAKSEIYKGVKNLKQLLTYLNEHQFDLDEKYLQQLTLLECCFYLCRKFSVSADKNVFVRFFCEHVWQRTTIEGSDHQSFIEWWEEKKKNLSVITPSEAQAVRIMTIHKSKGLQFPVVILPFASEKSMYGDLIWVNSEIYTDGILPVALTRNSSSLQFTELASVYTEEQIRKVQDSINLLYVAFTRPESALYVICSAGNAQNTWERMLNLYTSSKTSAEDGAYNFGAASIKPKENASVSVQMNDLFFSSLPEINSKSWREKLRISRSSIRFASPDLNNDAISEGNLVHALLENINSSDDLHEAFSKFKHDGLLDDDLALSLKKKIKALLSHPALQEVFNKNAAVRNEKEIIFPDGTVRRPDKVIFFNDKWIVLDFKTGLKRASHAEQIKAYKDAVKAMTNGNVEAMLVYITDEIEVQAV